MAKTNSATNGVAKADETTGQISNPELSTLTVDKSSGEIQTQEQSNFTSSDPGLPPIEARLNKLKQLQELVEKREVIVDHLENLNRFYISPNGQGCNLKLNDSKGNSFGIANPIVIGEIVHMSKAKLQDELTKIENAFVFNI
ncbi:MAG TPA: hypothetical protein VF610_05740 [Segetibacter sp.]|jgi:hypothetical protein